MRKALLIGHRGQLGTDLKLSFGDWDLVLAGQEDFQVQDAAAVEEQVARHKPDVILNCSAFHRVDDCEVEIARAFDVNVYGVRNLAVSARNHGAAVVHFSTDYVYDGARRTPYPEAAPPCPRSIYGVSKASGEIMLASILPEHFVFRVSGLYGYAGSREKGTNFVEMMIGLARAGKPIRVVDDQVLTPTATRDVAEAVRRVVDSGRYGLYHLTNEGQASWYEFTREILDASGLKADLTPVSSDQFPTKARRPNYSVLDNARLRSEGFEDMAPWQDALRRYLAGRQAAGRA